MLAIIHNLLSYVVAINITPQRGFQSTSFCLASFFVASHDIKEVLHHVNLATTN